MGEYINSGDGGVQKITHMNIDGCIERDTAFDYDKRRARHNDIASPEFRIPCDCGGR